jgi:hypothetical protein
MEFSLTDLLAQTESEDVSSLVVKLSDNGQDIETLKRRLDGAINAMEDYKYKQEKNTGGRKMDDDEIRQRISAKKANIKTKPDRKEPGLMSL